MGSVANHREQIMFAVADTGAIFQCKRITHFHREVTRQYLRERKKKRWVWGEAPPAPFVHPSPPSSPPSLSRFAPSPRLTLCSKTATVPVPFSPSPTFSASAATHPPTWKTRATLP